MSFFVVRAMLRWKGHTVSDSLGLLSPEVSKELLKTCAIPFVFYGVIASCLVFLNTFAVLVVHSFYCSLYCGVRGGNTF